MHQVAREELFRIDEILSKGGDAASDLWDVLSALRSDDNNVDDFNGQKKRTTVPIRRAAFPKTWTGSAEVPFQISPKEEQTHFGHHTRAAARVLGIITEKTEYQSD